MAGQIEEEVAGKIIVLAEALFVVPRPVAHDANDLSHGISKG